MISFNEIYTEVREAILAISPDAFVTSTYTPTPSKFPAVFVREIGKYTPPRYATLNNSENVSEVTYEVQIFSNKQSGAKSEADTLYAAIKVALKKQYFREASATPVDNADHTVYRFAATFRRIIADADNVKT